MKSRNYWTERFSEIENRSYKMSEQVYQNQIKSIQKTQNDLNKSIEKWLNRIAINNELNIVEARKLLNKNELKEFQWTLDEYIKYGKKNSLSQKWIKELENASAKVHIQRLEALKIETQKQLEILAHKENRIASNLAKNVYKETYFNSAYEITKGTNKGIMLSGFDNKKLNKIASTVISPDNKHFSERIWNQNIKMQNELQQELMRNIMLGKKSDDAVKSMVKYVDDKIKNKEYVVRRLLHTEQAFYNSLAQKDSFKDLDVKYYEILATLDFKTSTICRELDGKVFPVDELEPGITAHPFHPNCRSTEVPNFEKEDEELGLTGELSERERAARGKDGKTYYVPNDMKYNEWYETFVDNEDVNVEQIQKISKKKTENSYSVNRNLTNSKSYHDKFEKLTKYKIVNEVLYSKALSVLEHRDGTNYEDLIILDMRTGEIVVENTTSTKEGATGLYKEQFEIFKKYDGNKILLHNHPNSSRFSFQDISTLFKYKDVKYSVVVNHDGEVQIISIVENYKDINIDEVYNSLYNEYKQIYKDSEIAKIKALDDLYELGIFLYERR